MKPLTETLHLDTEIPRPRGDVWAAFADTRSRQQWSVPAGEALVYDHDDFRSGGSAEYRCGTPGQLQSSAIVTYIAVEEQSFAVQTESVWRGDDLLASGLISWFFDDVPAGTSVSIVDQVVSFVGQDMIEGSRNGHRIALEQLGTFLAGPGQISAGASDRDSRPS
ncbi:Uncharacterized conserved protein YndB, AHSA1/START domain [Brevibacterium sandarakinum]|uniref:Uncharacterized conserved protein YndB, AHSA1/START domain n=1 Tax=Brevibacterium sandarakinum TaxID=629680 RepID=A0A1H1LD07_BRESA|nr:SRPBCC domain-containing protein [Brevibacterium sandarakinum]SDR72386.1 Uncharacterized conserved protein YndB, AHSA1/START domain [Brevibacterium sandarakinum]